MNRTTNGAGWEVQAHFGPHGWEKLGHPFKTKELAEDAMSKMTVKIVELRVYESLKGHE